MDLRLLGKLLADLFEQPCEEVGDLDAGLDHKVLFGNFPVLARDPADQQAQRCCECDDECADGNRAHAFHRASEGLGEAVPGSGEVILAVLEVIPIAEHGTQPEALETVHEPEPLDDVENDQLEQPVVLDVHCLQEGVGPLPADVEREKGEEHECPEGDRAQQRRDT